MQRKVILVAGKTCVVSLPKRWVQSNGVHKGDSLEVQEEPGCLRILASHAEPEGKHVRVNLANTAPMTSRIVAALFKAGYDYIEADFSSPEEFEAVQHVLHQGMLGFELIHQGKHQVTLKKISSANLEEFSTLRNRLLFVIKSLVVESLEASRQNDVNWLQALVLRDQEINRISDTCRRMVSQQIGLHRSCQQYVVLEYLEKLADAYVDYCKASQVHRASSELSELHKRTNFLVLLLIDLLFSFSLPKAVALGSEHALVARYHASVSLRIEKDQALLWFQIGRVQEYSFDMLGSIIAMGL